MIRALVATRWPFRIQATYDETIDRFLGIFECTDRAVLSDDYLTCPDDVIRRIESVLTVCGGRVLPRRR